MELISTGFNYGGIRALLFNGEYLFCVSDIQDKLGLSSYTRRLDGIEFTKLKYYTNGGDQYLNFIDLKGLLRIIGSSRKTAAKNLNENILDKIVQSLGDASKILESLSSFEIPEEFSDMYVYAIREKETGNIKLGISSNPERRLKELQTANSSELELIGTFKAMNSFKDELLIHNEERYNRIRGEWFTKDIDLNKFNKRKELCLQ